MHIDTMMSCVSTHSRRHEFGVPVGAAHAGKGEECRAGAVFVCVAKSRLQNVRWLRRYEGVFESALENARNAM